MAQVFALAWLAASSDLRQRLQGHWSMLVRMLMLRDIVDGGILMGIVMTLVPLWMVRLHLVEGFCSPPGPLQTVQEAELWVVILALQASDAVHLGVNDLNVVRHVGRLLDGVRALRPLELKDDGDLI